MLRPPAWAQLLQEGQASKLGVFARAFPLQLGVACPDAWWTAVELENSEAVLAILGRFDALGHLRSRGRWALHKAIALGKPATAKKLLTLGVDPQRRDSQGNSALMLAVLSGQPDLVAVLLEAGADPYLSENLKGQTLLDFALFSRDRDVLETLMRSGISPDKAKATNLDRSVQGHGLQDWDIPTLFSMGRRQFSQRQSNALEAALDTAQESQGRQRF